MDKKTAPHPLAGDPGHEGGSKPMHSLKGGMAQPYVQQATGGVNSQPTTQGTVNTTSMGDFSDSVAGGPGGVTGPYTPAA